MTEYLVLSITLMVLIWQARKIGYLVAGVLNVVLLVLYPQTPRQTDWGWAVLQQPDQLKDLADWLYVYVAIVATGLYCAFRRLRVSGLFRLFALGINIFVLYNFLGPYYYSYGFTDLLEPGVSILEVMALAWIPHVINSFLLVLPLPASERPQVLSTGEVQ